MDALRDCQTTEQAAPRFDPAYTITRDCPSVVYNSREQSLLCSIEQSCPRWQHELRIAQRMAHRNSANVLQRIDVSYTTQMST